MSKPTFWQKALATLARPFLPAPSIQRAYPLNTGVTIYPTGRDETYINKGYTKNAWVYAIVSKCAKKFSQVPWYHYKIKTAERKTWGEYMALTKGGDYLQDHKAIMEARKMRTKSIDQVAVDSPLSKLLNQPNRNQSGSQFREQLYGFKLLTGEGNQWFARNAPGDRPNEIYIIPKSHIALVKGAGLEEIADYVLLINGAQYTGNKDNVLIWRFPNYHTDYATLSHLRGQSPLDAGLLILQSDNEATERLISMNKNQGVAGLVYNKTPQVANNLPSPEQAMFMRQQFNSIVNDRDLTGTIAYMTGDLGFMQFGMNAEQLKLLEQSDASFKALCNIFDVPWQLFGNADSYENRKQYKRDFIYDNIGPACYSLRDEWNAKLIREFNLDRERDVIDCDLMALPELAEDLKTQAETLKALWQLTPNQVLEYIGYDKSADPNMDKIYVPSSLMPLDQLNADLGAGLNEEEELLNP